MNSIKRSLKQDIFEIKTNIRFENLKNFRNGKIRTVLATAFLLAGLFILIPILTGSDFPENGITFIANIMGFTPLLMLLFALFLGSDAINREHTEKTALLIFPYPQKRSNLVISKYITHLLTSWFAISVYYTIIATSTWIIYGSDAIPSEMINSLAFSFLYMTTLLSFAFLLSAWLDSTAASATLTFFGVMILLPLSNLLLGLADVGTSWLFTNYASYISSTLGIASTSVGPGGEAGSFYGFTDAVLLLTLESIMFILSALYFAIKKEVS